MIVEQTKMFYDACYQHATPHEQVTRTIQVFLSIVIPDDLFGKSNKSAMMNSTSNTSTLDIFGYVSGKRFETQSYMDYLVRMDMFAVPWLNPYFNRKKKQSILQRKRRIIAEILHFLFEQIVIPFLRLNYFITDMHGQEKAVILLR
jgi:hypothetical protein